MNLRGGGIQSQIDGGQRPRATTEELAAAGRDLQDSILDDLAQRQASEPPLESLRWVSVDFVRSLTPEELEAQRQKRLLGEQHPVINAYLMARYESVEEMLRPALATRTGTDSDRDIYPWILAAVAVAAVRIAVPRWVRSGADFEELVNLLERSFAVLVDRHRRLGGMTAARQQLRRGNVVLSSRRAVSYVVDREIRATSRLARQSVVPHQVPHAHEVLPVAGKQQTPRSRSAVLQQVLTKNR